MKLLRQLKNRLLCKLGYHKFATNEQRQAYCKRCHITFPPT